MGGRARAIKVKTKTGNEEEEDEGGGRQHAKLTNSAPPSETRRPRPSIGLQPWLWHLARRQARATRATRAQRWIGSISVALRNTAFVHVKCENPGNIG